MTAPLFIAMPGNEALSDSLVEKMGAEIGESEIRQFPDGETYLRYRSAVRDREIILVCSLYHPDDRILKLMFAAEAARDLGALNVGLVAPYLAYMRQDRRFKTGEALTSRYFSKFLSQQFDWLVTIDPHLHRFSSLDEIYTIPTAVMHAAPLVSNWIRKEISNPLLIGPDSESEQWVSVIANEAGAPFILLEKIRYGDREVEISVPDVEKWRKRTPVLVDDIISTGRTMIETMGHLRKANMQAPICVGVHGLFAGNAFAELKKAGAAKIVTTDTIPHVTNKIGVSDLLAKGVKKITKRVWKSES